MPIGVRAKSASVAVAILVTAIIGAPAFAIEQPDAGGTGVMVFAKPSDRPRPSHPHATPTPRPTPKPTPKPTPRVTRAPNPTAEPEPTPRRTDRPRKDEATAKPSKRPSPSDGSNVGGSSPTVSFAPGTNMGDGGTGGASISRPTPEVVGLAAFLAAVVGLGSLWLLTRRRRRRPAAPNSVAATAEAAPSAAGWTNVRLDDNEALPSWLRAIAEPERPPLHPNKPLFSMEPPPVEPASEREHADRPARTFAEPLEPGAMRLALTVDEAELLDQPSDLGVTLTTLIAGDEVEIKDLEEPWVRVVTPIGSTGWLRAESLGVGGPPSEEPVAVERPAQPEPKRRGTRTPRQNRSARSAT
jgi:hypothetical protein